MKLFQSEISTTCRLIIMLAIFFCASFAEAAGIISVQSISIEPYNDAVRGLEDNCGCNIKKFVLSEMKWKDVAGMIKKERPDAIVAVGAGALKEVSVIHDIPVVYLMVLNYQPLISGNGNIAGITMNIEPDRQLELIKEALPEVDDLGVLYHPDRTGGFVSAAQDAAKKKEINLDAKAVTNAKDVARRLNDMGDVDAFWMLPDVGVVTPENAEIIFLYSLKNRVPVVTFSGKYLDMGAFMSIDVDPYGLGMQAGEMLGKVLSGTDIKDIPDESARKINVTINSRVAVKLGLKVSEEIREKSKMINGS